MIRYINIQGYATRPDADLYEVTELVREETVSHSKEAERLINEWNAEGLKVSAVVAYTDRDGEFLFSATRS